MTDPNVQRWAPNLQNLLLHIIDELGYRRYRCTVYIPSLLYMVIKYLNSTHIKLII